LTVFDDRLLAVESECFTVSVGMLERLKGWFKRLASFVRSLRKQPTPTASHLIIGTSFYLFWPRSEHKLQMVRKHGKRQTVNYEDRSQK
jgi:hypothetical protein